MQQAIAILDSGVGGLTVVQELMRQLPQEPIIYFGDTARAPYGPRSMDQVRAYTAQIVQFLCEFQPKMIVIACNTATAAALDYVRATVDIPVVGVIHPGARSAIKTTENQRIGVIGTEGTISSRSYEMALKRISPQLEVISYACPLLVPMVEKGNYSREDEEVIRVVRRSMEPFNDAGIDCLILGCTHYPFLQPVIADVMGQQVALINSAEETAREVSTILYDRGQLARSPERPEHRFYCSGEPQLFESIAGRWLGCEVKATLTRLPDL